MEEDLVEFLTEHNIGKDCKDKLKSEKVRISFTLFKKGEILIMFNVLVTNIFKVLVYILGASRTGSLCW